jgi:hypothetical protein
MTIILNGTTGITSPGPSVIEADTSDAALRITQVGTGNALVVEDEANPDATPTVIDSSGRLVVGDTTARTSGAPGDPTPPIQVVGSTYATSGAGLFHYQEAAANASFLSFNKSRGSSLGTQTIVADGDRLGGIEFLGSDGTAFVSAARIDAYVIGAPGANDMPGVLRFSTTADGANIPTERMRITSAGEVLVGGTTALKTNSAIGELSAQGTSRGQINLFRNDTTIGVGDRLGQIGFWGNDTTSNTPTELANIYAAASGTHGAGDNPTDLVFGCTNDGSETVAEFARLAQNGVSARIFEVRQPTLPNGSSTLCGSAGGTAGTLNKGSYVGVYKHSGITNACAFIYQTTEDGVNNYLWVDNSDVLRISSTITNVGTTGGTVVGSQTSDERLKDISGPVTYGLNEVLAIEPIAFTMKDDPNIAKIGFSAQQVQPIVPEAVYDTKECIDGYTENEETKEQIPNSDRTKLAMEYTQLIPVLVNAVKELKAELDSAKEANAALEARIAALEAQ